MWNSGNVRAGADAPPEATLITGSQIADQQHRYKPAPLWDPGNLPAL
jgi:hypothetical protein